VFVALLWLVPDRRIERVLVKREETQADLVKSDFLSRIHATRPPPLPDDFASIIYNDRPGKHNMCPFGETNMPQVSQPTEENQNYGRSIPEIQPKEVHTETVQGQQRRPEEKTGRRRQTGRRQ